MNKNSCKCNTGNALQPLLYTIIEQEIIKRFKLQNSPFSFSVFSSVLQAFLESSHLLHKGRTSSSANFDLDVVIHD